MKIFIPAEIIAQRQHIKVPLEKARYLLTVLRCKKGDALTVIDGKGGAYTALIDSIIRKDIFIDITREIFLNTELPVRIVLCQGLLKGEKMDWVVQKATELGIAEIVPLVTERSVLKETRKLKRWRSIAEEAAEQCGRAVVPHIREPQELCSVFEEPDVKGMLFWEKEGNKFSDVMAAMDLAGAVYMFIGPEGGFTADEAYKAGERGIITATLGKRILRAETAAIVAAALVQDYIENKG